MAETPQELGFAPTGVKTAGTLAGLAGYPGAASLLGSLGGVLGLGLGASQGNLQSLASIPSVALQLGNLAGTGTLGAGAQGLAGGLGFGGGAAGASAGGAAAGAGVASLLGAVAPVLGAFLAMKAIGDFKSGLDAKKALFEYKKQAQQLQSILRDSGGQVTPDNAAEVYRLAKSAGSLLYGNRQYAGRGSGTVAQNLGKLALSAYNMNPEAVQNLPLSKDPNDKRKLEPFDLTQTLRLAGQLSPSGRFAPMAGLEWQPTWQQQLASLPAAAAATQRPGVMTGLAQGAGSMQNLPGAFQRQFDRPQSDEGIQQALQMGRQFLTNPLQGVPSGLSQGGAPQPLAGQLVPGLLQTPTAPAPPTQKVAPPPPAPIINPALTLPQLSPVIQQALQMGMAPDAAALKYGGVPTQQGLSQY